jgi:regulator of nonsense transcripts 2
VYKGKYSNIDLVASIVAGLMPYHELVCIKLVDEVLEEIRLGLEQHAFQMQQRQIMNIKLVGELYNFCVIESQVRLIDINPS